MFQFRVHVLLLSALFVCMIPGISVPALADTAAVTWYTGGAAKITLDPVSIDHSAHVLLSGSTSQNMLIVTVAKKNGRSRTNPVPLAADGSFNVRYLLKDGVGTYTITLSGSAQRGSLKYQGLGYFTHTVKDALSADLLGIELNDRIIDFVTKAMGSSVGRGECWDLAQQALDVNLADWTRPTTYGRPLNPGTDVIKAGDIIQFRTVTVTEHLPGKVTKREYLGAPDHTAVIYKVLGKKSYTLAHQNVRGVRRVITSDINLSNITGGTYRIYRPVALMIQQ